MADDPTLRLMPRRLRNAITRGNCKGVAAWLDDNKQQVDELWGTPSCTGRATLLMIASGFGHASVVDLLLERGASHGRACDARVRLATMH